MVQSKKQKSLSDYFLAGREMRWLVVGATLMAALNSGLDYLMQPSAIIKFGVFALAGNLSWLLLYPYVFFITLPLYRKLGAISAYEFLEKRFDIRVRSLAAGIFMLWRLGWLATALYVPSLALSVAIGQPEKVSLFIIVIGCVATTYTMLGGIRAVVWTNLLQFCIMFAGLAASVVIILVNIEGGLESIFSNWSQIGQEAETVTPSDSATWLDRIGSYFLVPMTFFGMLIATTVARFATYTSDQVMVQRFQTARSLRDARKGFIITAVSDTIWMLTLGFIGLALFTYYTQNFGALPAWATESPDQIFPFFMTQVFPVGLVGFVIAAILAASLSSVDSAINSLTSVSIVDFYNRLVLKNATMSGDQASDEAAKARQIRLSRIITVLVGLIGITLSCNVARLGSLLEISNKLINSFTGPLLGIYLLGMFFARVNPRGALIAGASGTLATLYAAFQKEIHTTIGVPLDGYLSFLWPSLIGLLTTLTVGCLSSALERSTPPATPPATWKSIVKADTE